MSEKSYSNLEVPDSLKVLNHSVYSENSSLLPGDQSSTNSEIKQGSQKIKKSENKIDNPDLNLDSYGEEMKKDEILVKEEEKEGIYIDSNVFGSNIDEDSKRNIEENIPGAHHEDQLNSLLNHSRFPNILNLFQEIRLQRTQTFCQRLCQCFKNEMTYWPLYSQIAQMKVQDYSKKSLSFENFVSTTNMNFPFYKDLENTKGDFIAQNYSFLALQFFYIFTIEHEKIMNSFKLRPDSILEYLPKAGEQSFRIMKFHKKAIFSNSSVCEIIVDNYKIFTVSFCRYMNRSVMPYEIFQINQDFLKIEYCEATRQNPYNIVK